MKKSVGSFVALSRRTLFLLGVLLSLGVFGIFAWHSSAQKPDSDDLSGHTGTVPAAPLATIDVTEPTDAIVGVAATVGAATSTASTVQWQEQTTTRRLNHPLRRLITIRVQGRNTLTSPKRVSASS